MTHHVSTAELKRMSAEELQKEIYVHRAECAKMRIGLKVQSEKNHALYSAKRKEIARMMTVLWQLKNGEAAKIPAKTAKTTSPSQTTKTSVQDVSSASKKSPKKKS